MTRTLSAWSVRPRVPLLLVVGSLLAAGCGSDDSKQSAAEFTKAATAATSETSKIGDDVGQAVTIARTQTDAALASTFNGLTARVRVVIAGLTALEPPEEAGEEVDALAAALDTAAADLDKIAMAAGSSDPKAAKAATLKLVADSPAIMKANNALKQQLSSDGQ